MRPLFITAIGTDIGKTIVSAVITEHLKADYWKPVQCGDLHYSDTNKVKDLISNQKSVLHQEAYRLSQPFSPHKAADLDQTRIELENIILPSTPNKLVIEGAGGLMVPLNQKSMVMDLIKLFDAELVLVSRNYLGSINHTLLSLAVLKAHQIPVKAVIFNGSSDEYSERVIIEYAELNSFARIPQFDTLDKDSIKKAGAFINTLNL